MFSLNCKFVNTFYILQLLAHLENLLRFTKLLIHYENNSLDFIKYRACSNKIIDDIEEDKLARMKLLFFYFALRSYFRMVTNMIIYYLLINLI